MDKRRRYIVGKDIFQSDLERRYKNKHQKQLVTGQQLHSFGQKGCSYFWKALCFTNHVWDMNTHSPKKSGQTIDDVIYYVRLKMFEELNKDENELDNIVQKEGEEEADMVEFLETGAKDDIEKSENTKEEEESVSGSDIDLEKNEEDDSEKLLLCHDWFFPSYFAFILWGPFADCEN